MATDIKTLIVRAKSEGVAATDRQLDGLSRSAKKADIATGGLTSSWQKSLATYAKVVAVLIAVKKALDFGIQASDLAAQVNQGARALENMARQFGTTANEIISSMQRMSGQTLTQLDVIQAASRAALLGIPLNELDQLMRVARASATALGTDVSQMFDDIVTGIGRGSKMILDNLGIVFSATEAYEEFAKTQGKSAKNLTEVEKKQAFLNATLKEGERIMKLVGAAGQEMTDTEPVQIYQAAIKDLVAELGQRLLPTLNEIRLVVAGVLRHATNEFRIRRLTREALGMDPSDIEDIETLQDKLNLLGEEYLRLAERQERYADSPAVFEKIGEMLDVIKQQMIAMRGQMPRLLEAGAIPAAEEEVEAQKAQQLADYLALLEEAYSKTDEGQKEALESAIAYWEGQLPYAIKTKTKVLAVLRYLREEYENLSVQDDVNKAEVEGLAATRALNAAYDDLEAKTDELYASERSLIVMKLLSAGATEEQIKQYLIHHDIAAKLIREQEAAAVKQGIINDLIAKTKQDLLDMFETSYFTFLEGIGASIISGTESIEESLKNIGIHIMNALPQLLFYAGVQLIIDGMWPVGLALILASGIVSIGAGALNEATSSTGNAMGNVYGPAGMIQSFGSGGIVRAPTFFTYRGGIGQMGEEGEEAILPLKRMPTGRLGVESSGTGSVFVTVNNYTSEEVQTKERRVGDDRYLELMIGSYLKQATATGLLDGPMSGRYGLRARGIPVA